MALIRSLAYLTGFGGLGYVLMQLVTPNRTELSKVFPEGQSQFQSERLKRKQAVVDVLRNATESREPMYRKTREEIQDTYVNKK